ncbi:PTPA-CTERM sorting domain-containing protein [Novosphingobium aquimarinum]|uniref:PTPA-CTERM sorting domain-containing protein n=1 Tax=Novosphingobium aquimarinum TaxID=2682494 RepID=UPI0018DB790B|nr:PTPA-CTERM sorting domain-containing protein [Novosphingobium aquimarinum]
MLQFGLSSVSATLFSGGGTFIGNLTGDSSQTFTSLAAGDYYITVNGTAINPVLGGAYGLTLLADAAAPVPGPAALLPALVGAGAIAWRRRRSAPKKDRGPKLALA